MNPVLFDNQPVTPSKVVCIGRNYVAHIEELGNERPTSMVLFVKPNSAISATLTACAEPCRFEGEITFLVRGGSIAGVGFGLDLTKVDVQQYLKAKGLPWERAKAFDGSAVLSPFVPLDLPLGSLRMTLHVDGVPVQQADYDRMIHKPEAMLREIGTFMRLEDDDVIMSGTPAGVGGFAPGQRFTGRIYGGDALLLEYHWEVQPPG